jgi:hypothetical protein
MHVVSSRIGRTNSSLVYDITIKIDSQLETIGEVFLVARDNYEVEILFCELDKFHRQHESTEDCI